MEVKLNKQLLNESLKDLSKEYILYGPVNFEDEGTLSDTDEVRYGIIEKLEDLELNKKSSFSPKEIIFPIRETLFYFNKDQTIVPDIEEKKVAIFLRPCDINGIHKLDTIFIKNGAIEDFYYKRLREKVKFFMIECTEGFDTCFCVSMNSNQTDDFAAAFRFSDQISIKVTDSSLEKYFEKGEKTTFEPEFIQSNKVVVNIPDIDKVDSSHFEHPLWNEYTRRCIACGRCNVSCITCSCFTMQDVINSDGTRERRRRWAGCQIKEFSNMAGGHDFRQKNGEKMRFKTMHKINDYYKRFGEHMCVGCGRCDDVCPEYISFSKCINKLKEIVEEVK